MMPSRARQEVLPGQLGQQQQALPEAIPPNVSSPDCAATPPSPEAEPLRAPEKPSWSDGSAMPGQGLKPGPLPDSGGMLAVSQVSGQLRAPMPCRSSIPVAKDAEQHEQDHHGGVDEEGRSQRGSTGGSENDAEGYGAAQASMPRNFQISLEGYSLQKDDDGTYAAYRINVTAGLHTWHVLRRCVRVCVMGVSVCAFHSRCNAIRCDCFACDPRACSSPAVGTVVATPWRSQPSVPPRGLASISAGFRGKEQLARNSWRATAIILSILVDTGTWYHFRRKYKYRFTFIFIFQRSLHFRVLW